MCKLTSWHRHMFDVFLYIINIFVHICFLNEGEFWMSLRTYNKSFSWYWMVFLFSTNILKDLSNIVLSIPIIGSAFSDLSTDINFLLFVEHLDFLWFGVMLLLFLFCLEHLWSHLFSKICRWDISQHEQWVGRIACCWTFHASFDPWGFTLLLFLFHLIQLYFSVSSRKANNYSLVIFFGYSDKLL